MKQIALILTLILCSSFSLKDDVSGCLELDIVLVADLSDSVSGSEGFIHDAVSAFVNKFELADNGIRVGLITFNTGGQVVCPLTHKKDSLNAAVNTIHENSAQGSTNYTYAFQLALNEFYLRGRPNVLKMVILITDGEPNNNSKGEEEATLIRTSPGMSLWGIFVEKTNKPLDTSNPYFYYNTTPSQNNGGKLYLKSIVTPNCYVESSYENLVEQIKKLDICL